MSSLPYGQGKMVLATSNGLARRPRNAGTFASGRVLLDTPFQKRSPMSASSVEPYLRNLMEIRSSGAGVPEASYYTHLENLLNEVGKTLRPRVRCVLQLGNRGAGRPDGGLFTEEQWKQGDQKKPLLGLPQPPNRGAIEVKPTNDDAWVTADTGQVTTYWQHYRLVLVTNYRDFVLVGQDRDGNSVKLETYRLAESEGDFWAQAAHPRASARRHAATFIEFLERVLLHAAPLTAPRDVAWFLASYARTAMARIEGQELPALTAVRSALEEALGLKFVGDKGEHFFRSTFVQTLFYGIFSAWVLWCKGRPSTSKEQFRWQDTAWHLRVPIVEKLFYMMAEPAALRALGLVGVMEWAANVLNRVDRASFFSSFEEGRAVQYFYEPFLEAFDPVLRKQLGVWYTPPEIVQYMVARVDGVLRDELALPNGLADPNVYVLDPCCGTGSYLVEVLRRIHQTLQETRGDALVGSDVKAAALGRVFGFEILPAPFVVSHLQLGLLLQNLGAPLAEGKNERAGVYLTNALTGWEPLDPEKERAFQAMLKGFPELLEERDSAREVKRRVPILVVLGNPPYNGFAGVAVDEERELSVAYRKAKATRQPQGQGLNDLYVRFFRMAERRIVEQTGEGIVCLISNYSWLDGLSFTAMRERYLEAFDRVWIDCLNGDKYKTGKLTPDGQPDPSVFSTERNREGIQVGTAVATLVRKRQHDRVDGVRFRNLWGKGKRAELVATLASPDSLYEQVAPSVDLGFPFAPMVSGQDYFGWPSLPELLPRSFPGVKTSRDDVVVDIDRDRLVQRMERYFDPQVSHDEMRRIAPGAMESTARFKAEQVRDSLRKRGFLRENVVAYCYRPFDVRWLYWEPETNLLDRERSDYFPQVFDGNIWIEARKKQAITTFGRGYVTRHLADNFGNGLSTFFPLYIRETSSQGSLFQESGPPEKEPNLSDAAVAYLERLGAAPPEALFYHVVSVLHSPAYAGENAGALRQDWLRIPLPYAQEALESSAALGQQVAAVLDMEQDVPGVTTGSIRPELRSCSSPGTMDHLGG